MRNDKTSRSSPAPPHCSSCAQAMRLARKTRRFNGLPDLYIFECRMCQISHTEEGTPPSEAGIKTEIGSTSLVTQHAKSKDAAREQESRNRGCISKALLGCNGPARRRIDVDCRRRQAAHAMLGGGDGSTRLQGKNCQVGVRWPSSNSAERTG